MAVVDMKQVERDLRRMALMVKVFPRIAKHERKWFIERLIFDHEILLKSEALTRIEQALSAQEGK